MSNKKVLNIVLIVIGALMILPLFVGFINFVQSASGESETVTASLFGDFKYGSVKDILT